MTGAAVRSLGVARIVLGSVLLLRTTPLANWYPSPLSWVDGPLFGWPVHGWRAAWLGLALPDGVVAALCVVRTVAAAAFVLGIATRAAGLVAALCAFAVLAQDTFAFSFTRYILFLGTGVLALSDAGGALAVRASPVRDARGSLGVVQAFVASIYAWSGIAKLRDAWLGGRTLEALHAGSFLRGSVADWLTSTPSLRVGASVSVVVVELALGPLLLVRRTRVVGVVMAVAMHGAYEVTAHPDVMGLVMLGLLCAFLPVPVPVSTSVSAREDRPSP